MNETLGTPAAPGAPEIKLESRVGVVEGELKHMAGAFASLEKSVETVRAEQALIRSEQATGFAELNKTIANKTAPNVTNIMQAVKLR